MSAIHSEPTVFPLPKDFPVQWEHPDDEKLPLRRDSQHTPEPASRLAVSIHQTTFVPGGSRGFERAGQPVRFHVRRVNGYYYVAVTPTVAPAHMEEAGKRAETLTRELLRTFVDRWDNEWLPEIKQLHDTYDRFDLSNASLQDLIKHLEWSIETSSRFWDIHFEVAIPFLAAPSLFQDLYSDLFGEDHALDAYKLLQGTDNMSLIIGRALWDLSREAASKPAVSDLIKRTDPAQVMEALTTIEEGKEFTEKLVDFLEQYGKRSDTVIEVADPSWIEEPKTAIALLRNYLEDDAKDPVVHRQQMVSERERLVKQAEGALRSYPQSVRNQFEEMLLNGQHGHRIQEDHNWWLDQSGLHQVRQVFMEFGRRFADAGVIETPGDIAHFSIDEILEIANGGINGDYRSQVAVEKNELARWARITAPDWIGTDYGPPPDSPFGRAIGRFWGGPPLLSDTEDSREIIGLSGSSGTVTATARLVLRLENAWKLNSGEILVTPTTSPPWTPLFATASGIVTDTGGVLSHCAIVAREYGIPAVVGTGDATSRIVDGQKLEVNGDTGRVRIIT